MLWVAPSVMPNVSGMPGITWFFNDNGSCKIQDQPPPDKTDIKLTAGNDMTQYYTIQCMPTTKGIRTLGVRLAPDGNDNDEFKYQLQQAMTIKQCLSKAPLGCEHTHISFQSIWHAMIQYPLGAT